VVLLGGEDGSSFEHHQKIGPSERSFMLLVSEAMELLSPKEEKVLNFIADAIEGDRADRGWEQALGQQRPGRALPLFCMCGGYQSLRGPAQDLELVRRVDTYKRRRRIDAKRGKMKMIIPSLMVTVTANLKNAVYLVKVGGMRERGGEREGGGKSKKYTCTSSEVDGKPVEVCNKIASILDEGRSGVGQGVLRDVSGIHLGLRSLARSLASRIRREDVAIFIVENGTSDTCQHQTTSNVCVCWGGRGNRV
jgi:hypothetical protein